MTFVSGITHWKDLSMWASKIGFYVLIFSWLGFAIHFPASVLVNDFCIEVDNYVLNYNSSYQNNNNQHNEPVIVPDNRK